MSEIVVFLIVFCAPLSVLAVNAPFWLSAGEGRALTPQTAAGNIIADHSADLELGFTRYSDQLSPKVPPRQQNLAFFPCSQCHEYWKTNPEPRKLEPVHEVGLKHGQGRLWCLVCHDSEDRDQLRTVRDVKVDFNESWLVCGQCHSHRQRDWYYGAHGKRVYDWQGKPERYNCTHCHNPHRPLLMQRKPQPKPPVRAGLEPMQRQSYKKQAVWQKHMSRSTEVQDHE